ncbi:MAG: outer membrane lipoprotein carrier protein LolA [Deltaproteobacteria bacterium]|nr:outer membrane lipoprotein carrier protein LolA [Deltaproteobacteria bacterium]
MHGSWKARKLEGLVFAALIGLLILPGKLSGASQDKDDKSREASIVEQLQKSYDAIVDFSADFRQETEIKTLNRRLKARGKVYFKRPGKMLWRYEEPKGQWVLADGKSLYLYQPEQSQILKSPLSNAFRSDIPLSFLLGLGNLKRDFTAVLKGQEEGHYVLQLAPRGKLAGVGEVDLGVDRQSFDVRWARIRDAAGNLTAVRFVNMKKGVGLKDSLFRLQVPEGVDVMELGS